MLNKIFDLVVIVALVVLVVTSITWTKNKIDEIDREFDAYYEEASETIQKTKEIREEKLVEEAVRRLREE